MTTKIKYYYYKNDLSVLIVNGNHYIIPPHGTHSGIFIVLQYCDIALQDINIYFT